MENMFWHLLVLFLILCSLSTIVILNSLEVISIETEKPQANISVTLDDPEDGDSFEEGDEFELEATALCSKANCDDVMLYPQYCSGYACTSFKDIEYENHLEGLYSHSSSPKVCLKVKKNEDCKGGWDIVANQEGVYRLKIDVTAEKAPLADSDIITIDVIGDTTTTTSTTTTYTTTSSSTSTTTTTSSTTSSSTSTTTTTSSTTSSSTSSSITTSITSTSTSSSTSSSTITITTTSSIISTTSTYSTTSSTSTPSTSSTISITTTTDTPVTSTLHTSTTRVTIPMNLDPVADTGGPYSGEVNKEILFDGSKSTDDGDIVEYKWDFGDGDRGYGKISKHKYTKIGFYTLNLTVTDNDGKKDTDDGGVYVYPVKLYINVTISPSQERYEYGDLLKSVDLAISYLDGRGVEDAMVSGILIGKETVDLIFKEEGNGRYHADLYYPILKGEREFIDIYVNATDSLGNSERVFKKLILIPKDAEFDLLIQKPRDRLFAYEQEVGFEIKFINTKSEKIKEGEAILYESWADRNFSFIKEDDIYSLSYKIPKNVKPPISFIIHGEGVIGDKKHHIVKTVQLDVTRNLKVDFIDPKPGQYTPDIIEIRVNVTYPNGEIIKEEGMNATIGNYSFTLEKEEGYFVGNYTLKLGGDALKIKVNDLAGNEGEAEVQLSTEKSSGDYVFYFEILGLLLFLACCLLLMLILVGYYYKKRQEKEKLKKEYNELKLETESIKKLTKRIMHSYYTRKISAEEARKRILDYEKELMMGRERMKHVTEQLGMKKIETEWKEELIEWIVEKLRDGEDPRLLKKGLSDVGLDPQIVDKVKKTLM